MKTVDYYEILGIPRDSSDDTIKSAWKSRVLEYHPDRVEHLGSELKKHAQIRLCLLNEAKEILLDPETRTNYDARLDEVKSSYKDVECRSCSQINRIPRHISRSGSLKCRFCGDDLGITLSRKTDSATLEWLINSTMLTLRNISIVHFPEITVLLRLEDLEIEIRPLDKKENEPGNLQVIINQENVYRNLTAAVTSSCDWDEKYGIGWISLPGGQDRRLAVKLARILTELSSETPPSITIEKNVEREKWAHWTSIFILCSLFPLAPWQADSLLNGFSGDLIQCSHGLEPSPDWLENLKTNWRIFLGAPVMNTAKIDNSKSLDTLRSVNYQLSVLIREMEKT